MGRKRGLWVVCGAILIVVVATVQADEPDWEAMDYTSHADYQAVDGNGNGTFPLTDAVKLRGIWLNKPEHFLDPSPSAPAFMGGQWQIWVQAADEGDFGGTACWMGQFYGNLPFNPPEESYSDAEWVAELERLNHDPVTGLAFERGDLVEIRARAPGLYYSGKTNVNEQHTNDPINDFDVYLLEAAYGLPLPEVITLADVMDEEGEWIFDPNRAFGAERYQSTLVRVNNVQFVDTTEWGTSAWLEITDATGRVVPVHLGRGAGIESCNVGTQPVDLVGIWDQEDDDPSDGLKDGYYLWVPDYARYIFPVGQPPVGDMNCDGVVDFDDIQPFIQALGGEEAYQADYPCCHWLYGDVNQDGAVTFDDIVPFVGLFE